MDAVLHSMPRERRAVESERLIPVPNLQQSCRNPCKSGQLLHQIGGPIPPNGQRITRGWIVATFLRTVKGCAEKTVNGDSLCNLLSALLRGSF